jgi:hypothetical protein
VKKPSYKEKRKGMVNNLPERQNTKKNTKKTLAYLKEAELPR